MNASSCWRFPGELLLIEESREERALQAQFAIDTRERLRHMVPRGRTCQRKLRVTTLEFRCLEQSERQHSVPVSKQFRDGVRAVRRRGMTGDKEWLAHGRSGKIHPQESVRRRGLALDVDAQQCDVKGLTGKLECGPGKPRDAALRREC